MFNCTGRNDSYSLIAMGNVWLQSLYLPSKDKVKVKIYSRWTPPPPKVNKY